MPINSLPIPLHGATDWDAPINAALEALRVGHNNNETTAVNALAAATIAATDAATAQQAANDANSKLAVPPGGATGQIMAKNSNASGDYRWVDPAAANAAVSSVQNKTGNVYLSAADFSDVVSDADLANAITGLYTRPPSGIPVIDLSASIQASLAKADSALQSVPGTYATDAELATAIAGITLSALGGAPLASPVFTGVPQVPTATSGDNSSQAANTAFVTAAIDALVDGAPGTLDTLNQIATQLNSNGSAVDSLNSAISTKVPMSRTINGYDLSADRILNKGDIGLGNVDNTADSAKSFTRAQINDATVTGRAVMGAVDGATARAAIGAGTSSVAIGTTAGTAADAAVLANSLSGKEPTIAAGALTTYYRGDKSWAPLIAAAINDTSSFGRAVMTAGSAAAARSAIGAGTSSVVVGTNATDAKAGNWVPASTDISDSTAIGRTVLTSPDQTALRAAIGAGTSSLAIGTTAGTAADAAATTTSLNAKAPTASPGFTGIPTAPTAAGGTNTTQLATTAFVQAATSGASAFAVINAGLVGYNTTTNSWPTRPAINGFVIWISPQSASITKPSDMGQWDAWLQNPDVA